MQKEYVVRDVIQPPLQCGTIEQKSTTLYGHMAIEVLKILLPFFHLCPLSYKKKHATCWL
jgi:hypothetical protein